MKLTEVHVPGAFVISLERHSDERGFFARTFCRDELGAAGLETNIEQCSLSYNEHEGTLRGMHWQAAPSPEVKIVRCIAGAIHDVIVDMRPESPGYLQWFAITLDATTRDSLYVPAGCAHGYVTLTPAAEVFYQISGVYDPTAARGVRWDDPKLEIEWPRPPKVISERDRAYALL